MTDDIHIPAELKTLISVEQAWHYHIIPVNKDNKALYLLTMQFDSLDLKEELELVLGTSVHLETVEKEVITTLLAKNYPRVARNSANSQKPTSLLKVQDDGFVESLLNEARQLRSSDIHIESYAERCRIRFRVDGVLVDRIKLEKHEYPILINKLKISASCDIAEKRLPQDGRIRIKSSTNSIDIRVSILPTLYGEKIVLRILGTDSSHLSLDSIGMNRDELERFRLAIRKPNGIVLISGPTGSGKTTTLYSALKELNKTTRNILTIEDPVEYTLDGINQVQLKDDIGLNYPSALRTFLRQDPDIIMIGEIRDAETAQMAIRAALTGHLVLSTIHTNSAWGTISRLVDMGLPPYILSNVINLSVAQRLVRILCPACKKAREVTNEEFPSGCNVQKSEWLFEPAGCPECHETGYKGRKAIYEVLNTTKTVSELIKQNISDIGAYLMESKIRTLSKSALDMLRSGETSLEEVYPYLISEN